ncbi:two-component system, OmpR family, KDP operon response regulator KdpE [Kushneria avicenniae]|uniref:Two-component system, OmpR family, KDP operon response regulator KdpE n=1 Tax=Kushneria avicenniae TaxID=402385 RepID=A0A1I1M830_9GAMM|nr:response regulator [Kushneria avicenniae]SFC79378.1 two-component system, OmpR family, KDP operon response regulator KdpE [Kushneria avicenniae]
MTTDTTHILIIDDEREIRRFLRISLHSQGFEISEAASGREGIEMAQSVLPDLILLDLGLPDMDGQEVLKSLHWQCRAPVIVVSVREGEEEKVAALDAGAADYVTKPFGIRELLARIRVALRAHAGAETSLTPIRAGDIDIDLVQRRVSRGGETLHLTPREYAFLARLAQTPGQIVTGRQLLIELWGPVFEHNTHYLRILVSRLRQKLGDDPRTPSLIQTEAGIGYRLMVESDTAP